MPGERDHLGQLGRDLARPRTPEAGPAHAARPAITNAADPRLADVSAGTRSDLMHVQRTAGNAAVASLVATPVQRVISIDEVASDVPAPPASTDSQSSGAAAPGEESPAPEADHTITAGHIGLNAPIVEAPGIIRAQTVMADSIVATNYTPGAGNMW